MCITARRAGFLRGHSRLPGDNGLLSPTLDAAQGQYVGLNFASRAWVLTSPPFSSIKKEAAIAVTRGDLGQLAPRKKLLKSEKSSQKVSETLQALWQGGFFISLPAALNAHNFGTERRALALPCQPEGSKCPTSTNCAARNVGRPGAMLHGHFVKIVFLPWKFLLTTIL